ASCLVAVVVAAFSSSPIAKRSTDSRGAHAAAPDDIFCRLVLDPKDKFTRVMPPPKTSLRAGGALQADAVLSNITVNYTGFTPEAQASFQAAVDIWSSNVSSTVPIVVDAQFADLGTSGILGQAGSSATRDFSGTPRAGTWFPFPLANA